MESEWRDEKLTQTGETSREWIRICDIDPSWRREKRGRRESHVRAGRRRVGMTVGGMANKEGVAFEKMVWMLTTALDRVEYSVAELFKFA